ncbi:MULTISPECIES: lipocalin family protein [Croceibacter]|uniref:lipocalin family protein n=1 Tax=Croceibacter TaxID=216431 RepID=UPI002357D74D|nr:MULTISPECIES: lipocalin family protein [Croceibacter]
MKNLILAITFLLCLCSCSNDDDSTNQTSNFENLIVGEWQLIESYENEELISLGECELMTTFNFDSNNEFGFVDVFTNTNGTCSVFSILIGTYAISESILTYTLSSGDVSQVQITQLNTTLLELTVSTDDGTLTKVYSKISS